jgi:hypothetical protein
MVARVIILATCVMELITMGNVLLECCMLLVQHATTSEDINRIRLVIIAITMTTTANIFQSMANVRPTGYFSQFVFRRQSICLNHRNR